MPPKFSIIIPCFDHGHFLEEAVTSLMHQSFSDWEALIVNDGSHDNTLEIAGDLAKRDSRIQVINKANGGLSSARNAGLDVAVGEIVQFLDADDLLADDCLSEVESAFRLNAAADIVLTGYYYIDELTSRKKYDVAAQHIIDPMSWVMQNNLGPCHSVFIKRSLAVQLGKFDEMLRSAEDWDFWIRAVKAGARLAVIQKPLVAYRFVRTSMSRDPFRMYNALKTVSLRARLKDSRITIESELNKDYDVDVARPLKKYLLMCLGVSILQAKIGESVALFNKERGEYDLKFGPDDFSLMNSYLSFRYMSEPSELKEIFEIFYPNFVKFFNAIGFSGADRKASLGAVFKSHKMMRNRQRYGRILGAILNRFL